MLSYVTRQDSASGSPNTCGPRSWLTWRGMPPSTRSTRESRRTIYGTPRRSRGIWASTASILVLVGVLAGCGSNDKPDQGTPAEQVHATFRTFAEAYADKDWSKVCELYTPEGRVQIVQAGALYGSGTASCPGAMKALQGVVPVTEFALTDVKVAGATATGINPKAADPADRDVQFERTGEGWRIAVDGESNREGSP